VLSRFRYLKEIDEFKLKVDLSIYGKNLPNHSVNWHLPQILTIYSPSFFLKHRWTLYLVSKVGHLLNHHFSSFLKTTLKCVQVKTNTQKRFNVRRSPLSTAGTGIMTQ
jgi:hypothetical protein